MLGATVSRTGFEQLSLTLLVLLALAVRDIAVLLAVAIVSLRHCGGNINVGEIGL